MFITTILCPVDRYVMLGNHHDAWVFGAVDPNSGTATLMELARALNDLRSNSETEREGGRERGREGGREGGEVGKESGIVCFL